MNAPSVEERMDNLERIVEPLRDLPDRVTKVEGQIAQLRTEMRGEFSAIRRDMAGMATKADLAGMATKADLAGMATKADLAGMATKADLAGMATRDDLARMGRGLRRQTQGLHTRMLVLHEDIVERLKILGDAWSRRRPRSTKAPKKPRRQ